MQARMTFRRALLLLCLIWAGIYLPALGSLEIKGEEGRRILPGLAMIRTGDWVVPTIAGEPYLRKPPLVNWAVAGSVLAFGEVNEWTVRAPAVLATLAGGLLLFAGVARRHGVGTGFVTAVFHLTAIGLMEKGRLIEIESLYVACAAGAFGSWIGWCSPRVAVPGLGSGEGASLSRSEERPWIGWCLAGVFLGLGWLAKGPVHLLYFYGPVIAVLAVHRRLRDLLHPAHFAGLAVMGALFAAWAVPHLAATRALDAGGVWAAQFTGRLSGSAFKAGPWLVNFPRGLFNFLPWLAFFPLAVGARADREMRVVAWTCAACWFVVMLVPESAPRYTFPILPALMFAMARAATEVLGGPGRRVWARWTGSGKPSAVPDLAFRSGVVMVCITLAYALLAVPRMRRHEEDRPAGAAITAAVPQGKPMVALALGFRPFEFYIGRDVVHAARVSQIPADARFLLCEPRRLGSVRSESAWADAREIERIRGGDGREWILLAR
jgi:4-amino-4-deoxy-L-arabinose transferase-like glycosyltransferase